MLKKLAKLKYLPNNFEIVEHGDHVICAISKKPIKLSELQYWNVDLQEPYYSYIEAAKKKEMVTKNYFHLSCDHIHFVGLLIIIFSNQRFKIWVIFSILSSLLNEIGLKTVNLKFEFCFLSILIGTTLQLNFFTNCAGIVVV